MQPSFHYIVKAKLIRLIKGNEIDFLEFEDKFENQNPIIARENAFKHYQNYIDVLLQGKNEIYTTDRKAREELNSFIDPGTKTKIIIGEKEVEFSDSFGNGIGVFMIIDIPKNDVVYDDHIAEEIFIHGIGNISPLSDDPDRTIFELAKEFDYYKHYNYDTKSNEIQVIYCSRDEWEEGYTENEPSTYNILQTPFDWTGYDKPYWWGEPEVKQVPQTLEDIISVGETNQVEFKPTLLYNFSTGKAGIGIKAIIAKTICAFLNSNGGFLFIGITDQGEIQGLNFDFQLAHGKNPKDFFRLEFDQMLEYFLSFSVKINVEGEFFEKDGKDIFIVKVAPNKRRPIFLKGQTGKEFYVRGEASSRQLTDLEELVNYCLDRWRS